MFQITGITLALIVILPLHQVSAFQNTSQYVEEYQIVTQDSRPLAIGTDGDNNIWFVETDSAKLARFNPSTREFTEFKIPVEISRRIEAWDLLVDKKGALWFTDSTGHIIWRFDIATFSFERYLIPTRETFSGHTFSPYPLRLTLDQIGGVWFTELHGNRIGRVAPDSGVAEFELPTKRSRELPFGAGPAGITLDQSGIIWITEAFAGKVAKFNPATKEFTEYTPPRRIYSPAGISVDSKGHLWIADHGSSHLILYDPERQFMREYATPRPPQFPTSLPYWVAVDSSGDIWFNEHQGNKIARFRPDREVLIEYGIPTKPLANALAFAIDRENNVWFTELTANKIGVVRASEPIGFEIELERKVLRLRPGESGEATLKISGSEAAFTLELDFSSSISPGGRMVNASAEYDVKRLALNPSGVATATLFVRAENGLLEGTYTLAASASNGVLSYSNFLTLVVSDTPSGLASNRHSDHSSAAVMALGLGIVVALWVGAKPLRGGRRF